MAMKLLTDLLRELFPRQPDGPIYSMRQVTQIFSDRETNYFGADNLIGLLIDCQIHLGIKNNRMKTMLGEKHQYIKRLRHTGGDPFYLY